MNFRNHRMCVQSLIVWALVLAATRTSDAGVIPLQIRDRTAAPVRGVHSTTVRNEYVNRRMVWTNRRSSRSTPPTVASSTSAASYHVTMVPVRRNGQDYYSARQSPYTARSSWTSPPPVFIIHITLQAPSSRSVEENSTPSISTPQCIQNDDGNFRIVIDGHVMSTWPACECPPMTTTYRSTTCRPTTTTCRPMTTTCRPTTTTRRPSTKIRCPFTTTCHPYTTTCRPFTTTCHPSTTTGCPFTNFSKNQFFKRTLSTQCTCRTYTYLHGQSNDNPPSFPTE